MNTSSLQRPRRAVAPIAVLAAVLGLSAASAGAAIVSMPTPLGAVDFDSANFASAVQAGPEGSFGCFTAGTLSACTPASLQSAVLGPDLTTGLTLGPDSVVTLTLPATGSKLVFWEAGDFTLASHTHEALVAVHTSAGWSIDLSVNPGHLSPVLNDTLPSGYKTNYGSFSAADFGLAANSVYDAVRIRSCCGAESQFDLLAVGVAAGAAAAVPEPGTTLLFGIGLLAFTAVRRWGPRSA